MSERRGYRDDHHRRRRYEEETRSYGQHEDTKRRDRSRSRSPEHSSNREDRQRLEEERKARMARLRAENEQEERKLVEKEVVQEEPKRPEPQSEIISVDEEELEGKSDEQQMMLLLGFSGEFASTKGKPVQDNANSAARGAAAKNKERKYRQYMNRKGGFNRPLDKMN